MSPSPRPALSLSRRSAPGVSAAPSAPVAGASASSSDQEEVDKQDQEQTRHTEPDKAAGHSKANPIDPKPPRQASSPCTSLSSEGLAEAGRDVREEQELSEDEDTDTTYLRAIEVHERQKKSQTGPDAYLASTDRAARAPAVAAGTAKAAAPPTAPPPSLSPASPAKVPKLDFTSSELFAPGRATLEEARNGDLMASGSSPAADSTATGSVRATSPKPPR